MLEQLPRTLATKDSDSRGRWSITCYLVLCKTLSTRGLFNMVAAGRERVIADLMRGFRGHDLRADDYERIWLLLKRRVRKIQEKTGANPLIAETLDRADYLSRERQQSERKLVIDSTDGANRPLRPH